MSPWSALAAISILLAECPAFANGSSPAAGSNQGQLPSQPGNVPGDPVMELLQRAAESSQQRNFDEALADVTLARTIAQTLFPANDLRFILASQFQGEILAAMGRFAEAERPFLDAVAAMDARATPVPLNLRHLTVTALALLYQNMTRYTDAEQLLTSNIEMIERQLRLEPENPYGLAFLPRARNNLGFLYASLRRDDEAEAILLQALRDNERAGATAALNEVLIDSNLAVVYTNQQRHAEAQRLFLEIGEAMAIPELQQFPDLATIAEFNANNLARSYIEERRFAEAEPLLVRNLRIQEGRGANRLMTVLAVNNLADLYRRQGRYAEAESRFTRVLESLTQIFGEQHPVTGNAAGGLALARLSSPVTAASAIGPARRFVAAMRAYRTIDPSQTAPAAQRAQEQTAAGISYALLADAAWAAAEGRPGDRAALTDEAFGALQDSLTGPAGRAVLQMAVRQLADDTSAVLGSLVREREDLNNRWSVNSAEYSATLASSGAEIEALKQNLRVERTRIEGRIAEIDAALRRDFPQYYALIRPTAVGLPETQRLLRAGEAILIIVPTDFGTHVMAVTGSAVQWRRSDWTRDRVNQAVLRLLWDVGGNVDATPQQQREWANQRGGYDRRTAYSLYRQIVAPVESELRGARHVFVATGGSLTSLPLGMLVTEEPQGSDSDPEALRGTRWLADAHALIQIPSVQSLQFLRRFGNNRRSTGGRTREFVGFGDPLLEGDPAQRGPSRAARPIAATSGPSFFRGRFRSGTPTANVQQIRQLNRLPGTAAELEQIRTTLGAPMASLFLAGRATEANLRNADLADVRILALATHGVMAGQILEVGEPGLIFTPPAIASEQDDGFLTASEITTLRLNADWVLLSACNTAAGDGSAGAPGLSGLARAFFYAGARNILASHWPVRDDVAARLTSRTFQLLREQPGLSRAEAFQRAMREIREDRTQDRSGSTLAHPSAWAPFILIGDGAS